jgi:MFS family permease
MATTTAPVVAQRTAAEEAAYQRRWIALLLLSLSLLLIVIDSTIVNIAIPSIRSTFGASFADTEWVNSIYSLVFGAMLITFGKLGDQYGRRNLFILGTAVFLIGSAGTGLAANIGTMILFRGIQGLGAAMLSPSTLSIISNAFQGKERGIAFGIWGATAGVAAALGPILGGWLIEYGTGITTESWRLAFLINVPIGIFAIAGSFWAIREVREQGRKARIDFLGIVLGALGLGLIVFGAIEGQNYGWLEAKKVFTLGSLQYPTLAEGVKAIPVGTPSFIPFVFLAGAIVVLLFVLWEVRLERNGGEPLFEFGMLRYRSFRYGLLTVMIVALGEFGVVLVLSIFFQLAKGLGAFETGLRFLPFAGIVLIAAPLAGVLSSRFGAKWVVTAGMASEAIALFLISRVLYVDTDYAAIVPAFLLYGAGVGLAIAQLANIVLSDIPPEKAGVGSGANNTIRQLGASLGIAIIGAVLFGSFATEATPLIQKSTAFTDFAARVQANPNLSKESKAIGSQFGSFEKVAKDGIVAGLNANEGFSNDTNVLDTALANIPPAIKFLLKGQGIDLDNPAVVTKIKTELAPDVKILSDDIQNALATGFSSAGRLAAQTAALFVAGGAICSLLLPNRKRQLGDAVVVAAH